MAESTDKQTRKIAEKRVEKGKEFEGYQEAQNQLLAIQAEQKQNLALQANEAATMSAQNQTLGQAAEIMAVDESTQNILSGYGLNQPRVIRNSDVQKQGPNNITINNTTINNTSGPVQGREISIRPPENNQGRFKAWLTNVFARQDAEWQKRNQEYIRRESSLTRNANKMMRKIEGLGKEIGSVMDPRKIANTQRNQIKTLLTIIGLPLLAKYLPKVFEKINGIEKSVTGWFKDFKENAGDKIKDLFGIKGDKGIFESLLSSLHNQNENGVLDIILKKINEWLTERIDLANKISPIDVELLHPGESLKSFADWLSIVLGGTKQANRLVNNEKRLDLIGDLSKQNKKEEDFQVNALSTGYEDKEMFDDKGHRILMNKKETNRGSAEIDSNISSEQLYSEFSSWAEDKGLKPTKSNLNEYLRRRDDVTYTGEAIILTKSVHDSAKKGYLVFSDEDLNFWKDGLSGENWYGPLAASLDIVANIKKKSVIVTKQNSSAGNGIRKITSFEEEKKSILPNRILLLLNLLLKATKRYGPQPVFDSFLDMFFDIGEISRLETDGVLIPQKFKLIRERMTENDRQRYWPKGMKGYSDFYKKIVMLNVTGKALKLKEKDFNGNENQESWEIYRISAQGIANILEMTTKSSEETYTEEAQRNLINYLAINKKVSNQTAIYDRDNDYQRTMDNISAAQAEEDQTRLNLALTRETKQTERYSQEDANSYVDSGKSKIKQGIPRVSYVERSSDFKSPYSATDEEKSKAPRLVVGKSISGVTKAFGGTGALTSNFMEWRDNRFHYGIDLANSAGDEVKYPGYGTIMQSGRQGKSGTYIDIKDERGYTTRYYHTRLYGGLKPGSKVTPGQSIGITERKGENGNSHDPHIHVEVHDPDWSKQAGTEYRHKHYVNPLVYWSRHKAEKQQVLQPDNTDNSPAESVSMQQNTGVISASGGPDFDISPREALSPKINSRVKVELPHKFIDINKTELDSTNNRSEIESPTNQVLAAGFQATITNDQNGYQVLSAQLASIENKLSAIMVTSGSKQKPSASSIETKDI